MIQIPLTASQNSNFEADVDGKRYTFRFTYNARVGVWSVNLALGGTELVNGALAVIGCELFQGGAYPDLPRGLYMVPQDQSTEDATYDELGGRVKLFRITEEDGLNVPAV